VTRDRAITSQVRRQWWGAETVNLESGVPLTDQLEAILRRRIAGWTGWMPSESELMEHHGVSRVTVRRALGRLEAEGLVFGAKGRGWFVVRREPS
jgi:GntR family transcriptional regulator